MKKNDMFVVLTNPSCSGIAFKVEADLREKIEVVVAVGAYKTWLAGKGYRASIHQFGSEADLLKWHNDARKGCEAIWSATDRSVVAGWGDPPLTTSWAEYKAWLDGDGQAMKVSPQGLVAYLSNPDNHEENLFPTEVP